MSEYTWSDTDGNGTLDSGLADLDGDGYWDTAAVDINSDGVIDTYQLDADRDGVIGDETRYDLNQDGLSDAITYDHDENLVVDGLASDATGWQVVAPEPATGFTTTMPMQGSYSEPPSDSIFTTTMPMQGAYSTGPTGESPQTTFARLLETETNPQTQVQLANAIALGNLIDVHDPWTW